MASVELPKGQGLIIFYNGKKIGEKMLTSTILKENESELSKLVHVKKPHVSKK